jgi:hypothetical protein
MMLLKKRSLSYSGDIAGKGGDMHFIFARHKYAEHKSNPADRETLQGRDFYLSLGYSTKMVSSASFSKVRFTVRMAELVL